MPKISSGIVVDVEATCWEGEPPIGQKSEIIEIGFCVVDFKTDAITFTDSIIVKPEYSQASEFCDDLTGLSQRFLDEWGVLFSDAIVELSNHIPKDSVWISWGDYDRIQFQRDCEAKGVKYPFGRRHINLKTVFALKNRLEREISVGEACEYVGLEFEGFPHRGEDDAYNIARLLLETL